MSIINNTPNTIEYPFGTNFDGRLIRTSTSGIQLEGCGGSSKRAFVRDIIIDLSIPLTLTTNSSAEYIITGTTTVTKGTALSSYSDNNYTNYGLHYVYLCNYWDCWNFSGYNRQGKLIISPTAPAESGYLSDYGNGAGARQVGWIICNSSRLMDNRFFVASVFNGFTETQKFTGTTAGWVSLTQGVETDCEGCVFYAIIPANATVVLHGTVYAGNADSDNVAFEPFIYYGGSKVIQAYQNLNNSAGALYHHMLDVEYGVTESSNLVRQVKLVVKLTGANSTPQYYPTGTRITLWRHLPQQPTSFTRIYTRDYEDVARPMVGGRLERVSDTSIEWQPSQHGSIGLYNGLNWVVVTPSSNPSISNSVSDIDLAALTYDYNYDVYAEYSTEYSFNLVLKKWTNNTTRTVTPGRFQGVLVYDATTDVGRRRRFLGTTRLRNDSGAKFTDTETTRYICNLFNTKLVKCFTYYNADTWVGHTSSSYREVNAGTNMVRGQFVLVSSQSVNCYFNFRKALSGERNRFSIGINSTSGLQRAQLYSFNEYTTTSYLGKADIITASEGYNYITLLEYGYGGSWTGESYSSQDTLHGTTYGYVDLPM